MIVAEILEVVRTLAANRATAADIFAVVEHVGIGFVVKKVLESGLKWHVDFAVAPLVFGTVVGKFVVCVRSDDFQLSDVQASGLAQSVV